MNKILSTMCALFLAAQFNLLSAQTTVMKVWKGGNVTSSISTADVDSVTFETNKTGLDDGVYLINGHKFVDLGLPSGLLWAEANIGAETAADDGNYYAWGETTTKYNYDWITYKYGTSFDNMTKYNSTDGKTVLENSDDAAYVNWGSPCRMPTQTEFEELCNTDNCTWTWTSKLTSSNSTIEGYEVTSKKNGNSIFLPASGLRIEGYLDRHGLYVEYWSSTLDSYDTSNACCFDFFSIDVSYRYYGYPVRPVAEKNSGGSADVPSDKDSSSDNTSYKIINGHKFINLGLPSGLLWAETNIGAESAADDGNYYAWGETATKDIYNTSTYKYYDTSSSSVSKYTSTDGKTVLENSDDAAYVNWGFSCRMPTRPEFTELCDTTYCTWTWTSRTNSSNETINGYEVTSKKNGNSIFLPASGYRSGSRLKEHGSGGYYWSGTLNGYGTSYAYVLIFGSGGVYSDNGSYRCLGHTVRPVAEP
jgi:hypothetical protein